MNSNRAKNGWFPLRLRGSETDFYTYVDKT